MAKPKVRRQHIRALRHGDTIPTKEPRRRVMPRGYVRLEWATPGGGFEWAYEHRVVMGMPPNHLHVHHINGDKGDNRRENLEVVTASEHSKRHRRLDHAAIIRRYQEGLTMDAVGEEFGTDSGMVSRILKQNGIPSRGNGRGVRKDLDLELIRSLYEGGVPVSRIAQVMRTTRKPVHNRISEMGLSRPSVNRQRSEEKARADSVIQAAREDGRID